MESGDFHCWIFCPGMAFGSMDKWWGDRGRRDFPHEGIDCCLYLDPNRRLRRLDETTRIPVMRGGVVRALFDDYLGRAVIIEHATADPSAGTHLSVYAHATPEKHLRPGVRVAQGDILGTIADTRRSRAKILPHLHLTLAQAAPDLSYESFVWDRMRDPGRVSLLDPLPRIDGPCTEPEPGDAVCRDAERLR
jgi:murein DD-endopeptidase MepM/ murein hydrolase activator NlpD